MLLSAAGRVRAWRAASLDESAGPQTSDHANSRRSAWLSVRVGVCSAEPRTGILGGPCQRHVDGSCLLRASRGAAVATWLHDD